MADPAAEGKEQQPNDITEGLEEPQQPTYYDLGLYGKPIKQPASWVDAPAGSSPAPLGGPGGVSLLPRVLPARSSSSSGPTTSLSHSNSKGFYRTARTATVITSGSLVSSSSSSRRSTPHSRSSSISSSGSSPASRSVYSSGGLSSCSASGRPTPRRITADLLTQTSVCNGKKRGKDESLPHFLSGLTHLNLHGRGITRIEHLEHCNRLQVLYLYDNYLERVEGLQACSHLTHLHLQDNQLRSLQDSSLPLARLQKLYLCGNRLERLSGLCPPPSSPHLVLQELHVSNQHLPQHQPLAFEPASLQALAHCLVVLNVSGTGLVSLSDLCVLGRLERLNAAKNQVEHVHEVEELLVSLPLLKDLDTRGNPVCRGGSSRYRETAVLASHPSLELLDGKEVRPELRDMLLRLHQHKARVKRGGGSRAAQQQEPHDDEDEEGESGSGSSSSTGHETAAAAASLESGETRARQRGGGGGRHASVMEGGGDAAALLICSSSAGRSAPGLRRTGSSSTGRWPPPAL